MDNKIEELKNLPIMKGVITTSERKIIQDLYKEEKIQNFVKELKTFSLKYVAVMNETSTKLNILNEDFKTRYNRNPIDHIESRIKSPESLIKKMLRNNIALNLESLESNIYDIAGVRVICPFLSDIPIIIQMIKDNPEFNIIKEKDYITKPKESGYRSYHIIVQTPIYLTTGKEFVNVEIQIRTMAMDFWASLEHQMKYKFDGIIPEEVHKELVECAESINNSDKKMLKLSELIIESNLN